MDKRPFIFILVGTTINILGFISPQLGAKVAMYLFQKPRRKKLNERQIDFLNSAKITIPDGQANIAYYSWGTGERSILLNHGWESGVIRWKPYIDNLINLGYRVIAVDAPGHGLSTAPKFNAYLYSMALYPLIQHYQPEIVIGHSIGGFVSILTGAEREALQPDNYILLAPNNKIKDTFQTYQKMIGMTERVMKASLDSVPSITPEGKPIDYFASETLIKRIPVPITIIHDKEDSLLPYTESEKLASLFPNVTLHITEGYGHRLKSTDIVQKIVKVVEELRKDDN